LYRCARTGRRDLLDINRGRLWTEAEALSEGLRAGIHHHRSLWKRIVWRVPDENAVYVSQEIPPDGIVRSQVFPGLWLDATAFWTDDGAKMLAALNAGLASEDRKFVDRLTSAK
jgi:hypothetical protein